MLENGYIKLHRKLIKWKWYHDANTFRVFIHLLLTANYERGYFEGHVIERGQCVTSVSKMANILQLTDREVRTALNHLKTTNEVTNTSTPKFSIISIKNYDRYQLGDKQNDKQTTSKRQANDKQMTNERQQCKKDKESKRKIKKDKEERGALHPHGYFDNVLLSDFEIDDLKKRFHDVYQNKIDHLSRYMETTGKSYQNHYAVLIDWLEKDSSKIQPQKTEQRNSYEIDELEKIDTLDFVDDW